MPPDFAQRVHYPGLAAGINRYPRPHARLGRPSGAGPAPDLIVGARALANHINGAVCSDANVVCSPRDELPGAVAKVPPDLSERIDDPRLPGWIDRYAHGHSWNGLPCILGPVPDGRIGLCLSS